MAEARRLSIGRVTIDGEDISFEAAPAIFAVRAAEPVELMVQYAYREASDDQEHVRLVLSVELDGQKQGSDEREIQDRPMIVDDGRSFLAVPLKVAGAGAKKGRYHLMARYAVGPWNASAHDEWILEREGEFTLDVEAPRAHRV